MVLVSTIRGNQLGSLDLSVLIQQEMTHKNHNNIIWRCKEKRTG